MNIYSSLGCNGNVTWLECPDTKIIRVTNVLYGRNNNSVCLGQSNETLASCDSQTALETLSTLCNGQNDCAIIPSTSLFGDPCPGVSKYADIEYACAGMVYTSWTLKLHD